MYTQHGRGALTRLEEIRSTIAINAINIIITTGPGWAL
jgi:hypothetical protein